MSNWSRRDPISLKVDNSIPPPSGVAIRELRKNWDEPKKRSSNAFLLPHNMNGRNLCLLNDKVAETFMIKRELGPNKEQGS